MRTLGEVDGDTALMQLVNVEAERQAVDIPRDCMTERDLERTVWREDYMAARELERTLRMEEAGATKVEEQRHGG